MLLILTSTPKAPIETPNQSKVRSVSAVAVIVFFFFCAFFFKPFVPQSFLSVSSENTQKEEYLSPLPFLSFICSSTVTFILLVIMWRVDNDNLLLNVLCDGSSDLIHGLSKKGLILLVWLSTCFVLSTKRIPLEVFSVDEVEVWCVM